MPASTEPPPLALRRAIERLLDGVPLAGLREATARLAAAYRAGGGSAGRPLADSERLAYAAARLPSTFEATRAVFGELRRRAPDLRVSSLLEIGAGPAPGSWAAAWDFPELSRATHVETDAGMATLGRRLLAFREAVGPAVASTWIASDAAEVRAVGQHDLVLAGYLLGELSEAARDAVVDAAWEVTGGALVVLEPGTPAGADRVLRARSRLLAQGAMLAAPCPHAGACPLPADDWCHFGVRVARSGVQRRLKGGVLPYEDEKYAYVAVTRGPAVPCAARVLRRPELEPRRVSLRLCAAAGLRRELVTRREGERYRAARKMRWGDAWTPPEAAAR